MVDGAQDRGRLIVVEGGDGSGKGGVIEALSARLGALGHDLLVTREPGGTDEGLKLRELLLSADGAVWDQGAELLLMTAARIQHVKRVIRPALRAGRTILCDRFVGSTLAYQGAGRGISEQLICGLHRDLVEDLWPDITVLLDVDPRVGLARSRARLGETGLDEGRFEDLDIGFHDRVRAGFLDQARHDAARTLVIDAARAPDAVRADAVAQVMARLEALAA